MLRKILCALLASIMLVGTLASCANGGDSANKGKETQLGTDVEEETGEKLEIPDTYYNGQELCFLVREEGSWSTVEIFTESKNVNSDNISYAVFERNDRILQKYGVTITQSVQGSITNEVAAPTGDFKAGRDQRPQRGQQRPERISVGSAFQRHSVHRYHQALVGR